jgi:hypothetical protein
MGVYELSGAGSLKTGRTLYTSMNAGNQYGAMVPIQSATLGSATNEINFLNVPQTYQDLRVVFSLQNTSVVSEMFFTFNNDFASNSGSRTILLGDGSSASSSRRSNDSVIYIPMASSSTIFTSLTIDILNYTSATQKTVLWRSAQDLNGSGTTTLGVGRKNIGAITTINLNSNGGNYSVGTTATLYGIRAVSS